MVLPVRWTAGGVWNRQDHTTVGISGNFEQLEYVSNNLPPSLVSSLRWPSSVAEADLCKGQSSGGAPAQPPQSLTSPSFCNRARSLTISKLLSSGEVTQYWEPGARCQCPVTKSYICSSIKRAFSHSSAHLPAAWYYAKATGYLLFSLVLLRIVCSKNRSAGRNRDTDKRLIYLWCIR